MLTSSSLLVLVQAEDALAWRRLVRLYTPMIYRWARRAGLQEHDASDVVQQVFLGVLSDISQIQCQPNLTFRGWLRAVCNHRICDHFRRQAGKAIPVGGSTANHQLDLIAVTTGPALVELDETDAEDEIRRLRHRALRLVREQFEKHEWESFYRMEIHGDRAADVASDLKVSISTVYRARDRVLQRLRADLTDW